MMQGNDVKRLILFWEKYVKVTINYNAHVHNSEIVTDDFILFVLMLF